MNSYKFVCKGCGNQYSYPAKNWEYENHECKEDQE